ncbi:MAG: hypothetical protein JXA43_03465 [Candidatus Diapherotrites archaeon]|nr:hypothetical protein [Candidatus Diapherotrites archaeon]
MGAMKYLDNVWVHVVLGFLVGFFIPEITVDFFDMYPYTATTMMRLNNGLIGVIGILAPAALPEKYRKKGSHLSMLVLLALATTALILKVMFNPQVYVFFVTFATRAFIELIKSGKIPV